MAAGCSLSALQTLMGAQEAEGLLRSGVPGEQCWVVWSPGGSLIPHGPFRLPHPSHREWKVALEPKSQLSVHEVKIKHLLTTPPKHRLLPLPQSFSVPFPAMCLLRLPGQISPYPFSPSDHSPGTVSPSSEMHFLVLSLSSQSKVRLSLSEGFLLVCFTVQSIISTAGGPASTCEHLSVVSVYVEASAGSL